jgi:two-component system, CitB family, response regulator CitT
VVEKQMVKILIIGSQCVDDGVFARLGEKKLFFEVNTAITGKEALTLLNENHYDLIVVDLFLPDVIGYELISEIRRAVIKPRIIAITDSNSMELEWKTRKEGVDYYMIKQNAEELEEFLKSIYEDSKKKNTYQKEGRR